MLHSGMHSTLSVVIYFVPASVLCTPSSHPTSPSDLKMYFVPCMKPLHTRNPACFGRKSCSSSLGAFIVDSPHLHSRCQTLGFHRLRPRVRPHLRNLSTHPCPR